MNHYIHVYSCTLVVGGDTSGGQSGVGGGGTGGTGNRVQRILERSKASLSRSKSELGEQHKRIVWHLSKSAEHNRRLLANLGSRGKRLLPKQRFDTSNKDLLTPIMARRASTTDGTDTSKRKPISSEVKSSPEDLRDLDRVLLDLGISPNSFGNNNSAANGNANADEKKVDTKPSLERCLEQKFKEEFEFIDDLTLKSSNVNGHDVDLAGEVFGELDKSDTFKKISLNYDTKAPWIMSSENFLYGTTAPRNNMKKRRERRLSSTSFSGSYDGDQEDFLLEKDEKHGHR